MIWLRSVLGPVPQPGGFSFKAECHRAQIGQAYGLNGTPGFGALAGGVAAELEAVSGPHQAPRGRWQASGVPWRRGISGPM